VVGARIETDAGLTGYGYTGTHAHLPSDQLITRCIDTCHAPLLIGEDAGAIERLWHRLARNPALQWVGRAGITTLAHAAIDVALWDLKAKAAQQPLHRLLGGPVRERVRAYNTDIGWLNIDDAALVAGALRAVEDGFTGIKIKVGSSVPRDLRRLEAVRRAIGADVTLAIDGNGKLGPADLPRVLPRGRAVRRVLVRGAALVRRRQGPRQLARATRIPIALGEQLYTTDAFAEFFAQQAIAWVQPDVTRMAGLSEVLKVCDTAGSFRLPVAPHAGDMSQVHVHLAYAHPAVAVLEYIPWIKDCFTEPAEVVDGHFKMPVEPGAGTTPVAKAWSDSAGRVPDRADAIRTADTVASRGWLESCPAMIIRNTPETPPS
jgi:L-alanine-DL-glutamate epimerase-like enolase superfamily enzyme